MSSGRIGAPLFVAILAVAAWACDTAMGEPGAPDAGLEARFTAFVTAWRAKDPDAVLAQVDPAEKGTVRLTLLDDPPIDGSFGRAQAKQTVKAYFGRLRGAVQLKDVTTAESKKAVPGTRIFDYTYRREGRDPVTTRLEATLKQVSGAWVVASVGERPRPRPAAQIPGR